jgi:CheY-like chemotaxis protein
MAHILIAEDERDIRELIVMMLTFSGHTVTPASDGQDAVDKAQSADHLDLILLDVSMPRLTGYDACRQIKALDAHQHVPVVFLTAQDHNEESEQGKAVGAYAYIHKPFAPNGLVERINQILAETR